MNRDTPDAVPADDFPFLGPAISPRRRDAGFPLGGEDELSGPFVRHVASAEAAEAAAPLSASEATVEEPVTEQSDDLPAVDWPSDDFPWLLPAEPESAAALPDLPSEPLPASSFEWQDEVSPAAEAPPIRWDDELVRAAAPDAATPEADAEFAAATDFVWDEEASALQDLDGETAEAEAEPFAGLNTEEERPEAPRWVWEDAGSAVEEDEVGADRWESDATGFAVRDEVTIVGEGEEPVSAQIEVTTSEAEVELPPIPEVAAPPLEAAALPIGEWEDAAPAVEVADEVPHAAEVGATTTALEDVAARLERIARSLRSGNPLDAFEQGDPLQLLITGYALGYSEARKAKG